MIVDGNLAFVGGINIADEYIHEKTRFGIWRDNGMKILGDATYNYLLMFASMWYMSTKEMLDIKKYKSELKLEIQKGYIFPFSDGPINRINPAYDLFLKLINNAKEKIYISTPYLVIDNLFLKAISDQAKSGLDVYVLVPEIPDKKLVYMMTENNYKKLIEAGVKVYKYKDGFNHAKTLIIDGKYSVIGTINTDYRSMFLHFECGNFLIDTPVVKEIEEDYLKAIDKSILVKQEDMKKINLFKKIFSFLLSIFSPLF
jgi:cardiolipin synthase